MPLTRYVLTPDVQYAGPFPSGYSLTPSEPTPFGSVGDGSDATFSGLGGDRTPSWEYRASLLSCNFSVPVTASAGYMHMQVKAKNHDDFIANSAGWQGYHHVETYYLDPSNDEVLDNWNVGGSGSVGQLSELAQGTVVAPEWFDFYHLGGVQPVDTNDPAGGTWRSLGYDNGGYIGGRMLDCLIGGGLRFSIWSRVDSIDSWRNMIDVFELRLVVELDVAEPPPPPPPPPSAHHGTRAFKFTSQADTSEQVTGTGSSRPGTPTMESTDPGAVLVQPGSAVWSDDDDATYTEHLHLSSEPYNASHSRTDTGKVVAFDPIPDDATFVRMRVRASIPSTNEVASGTVALNMTAYQTVSPFEQWYFTEQGYVTPEIPSDGQAHEMDQIVEVTKYWNGAPDVAGFMAAVRAGTCEVSLASHPAHFFNGTVPNEQSGTNYTTTMRIYEVALVYQTQTTVTVPAPRAVMVAEGPDEASEGPGWANHRGMFRIPSARTISAQFQVRCEGENIWAMPYARFFHWDGTQMLLQDEVQASHPKKIMSGADWTEFTFHRDAYDTASHWMLAIQFSVEDPRFAVGEWPAPPDPSTAVYVDCVYVPENGLSLIEWEQDYLDGDQPGAYWEGRDQMSTSTKGEKPPDNLSEIILLDDELFIP